MSLDSFMGIIDDMANEGAIEITDADAYAAVKEDMKKKKLAYGMDKMLEVFLDDNISEYFFYKEDGKWVEELK